LFSDPAKKTLDVAQEVGDCLYQLQNDAELMWLVDDEHYGAYDHKGHLEAERRFYGHGPEAVDPVQEALFKAQKALQEELHPILLPTPSWFTRHWLR
jgi:hypothetical protein